jgi:dephospho-CoA kinase
MTILLGLTGSIGMGKSTVAAMFQARGVPVFDADAEVRRLQGKGGMLVDMIEALYPGTTDAAGVNRIALARRVLHDKPALRKLERLVHPRVDRARRAFLRRHRSRPLVLLDIPLLFERGGWRRVDYVAVVSAPAWKQADRVLARPGMTGDRFARVRSLQLSDARKRARADFVIPTGGTRSATRAAVRHIVACLQGRRKR